MSGVPDEDYQLPDFELRNLILNVLKAHPRPITGTEGAKVACKCGWRAPTENSSTNGTNQLRFRKHQSFEIEYAVTALLNEQEEAA